MNTLSFIIFNIIYVGVHARFNVCVCAHTYTVIYVMLHICYTIYTVLYTLYTTIYSVDVHRTVYGVYAY